MGIALPVIAIPFVLFLLCMVCFLVSAIAFSVVTIGDFEGYAVEFGHANLGASAEYIDGTGVNSPFETRAMMKYEGEYYVVQCDKQFFSREAPCYFYKADAYERKTE
jgi:hypothetical protein